MDFTGRINIVTHEQNVKNITHPAGSMSTLGLSNHIDQNN